MSDVEADAGRSGLPDSQQAVPRSARAGGDDRLLVSLASWSFLALVHEIQVGVYEDLPGELGYDTVPWWWPLPWLALAGVLTALAILRLPGHGGHVPADGLKTGGGPTQPIELPGVLLAALATLGLGLVLGPEGPLIALGMGLAVLAVRLVRKDAPQQVLGLMAAAGSFAAISTVFGSPVIGAVILLEAAALGGGGPTLSLVLLPGLIAAGLGSLVFIGMGDWTGLSTSAWALSPLDLPPYAGPDWGDFVWTIVLAIAAAVVVFVIVEIARLTTRLVSKHRSCSPLPRRSSSEGLPSPSTRRPINRPTRCCSPASTPSSRSSRKLRPLPLRAHAAPASSRGSPGASPWATFEAARRSRPCSSALSQGSSPPTCRDFSETPAVAALMAAACVSILRLPLASVVVALL